MWIWIIIIVAVIGGVIGYFSSQNGERGQGFLSGLLAGGMGCGYIILQIFLVVAGLAVVIWLFSLLFR